jgi:hypothetical protein
MASEDSLAVLDARRMRMLFNEIGRRFAERGQLAEIAVFGGSALILTFDYRDATRDIDYVRVSGDKGILKGIAEEVGRAEGLPVGWFNDAVSIFTSDTPDYRLVGDFPAARPGLRVFSASPRYVLAMKVMAMRSSLETNDMLDVWHLIDACGIRDAGEARELVAGFFPGKALPRRNELILADVFEAKDAGREYSRAIGY